MQILVRKTSEKMIFEAKKQDKMKNTRQNESQKQKNSQVFEAWEAAARALLQVCRLGQFLIV